MGETSMLRGCAKMGLEYANPAEGRRDREVDPAFYSFDAEVMAGWGAKLTRIPLAASWYNTDSEYRAFVRQQADAYAAKGLYLIMDCHYPTPMQSLIRPDSTEAEADAAVEPMIVALEQVARDYADQPMFVGVEINEPWLMDNHPDKQHVWMMKMYNRLAQRVHAINPNLQVFMNIANLPGVSDAVLEDARQYLTEPYLVMAPHIYEAEIGFPYQGKYYPDDGADFWTYYQSGDYEEAKTRFYLYLDVYYKQTFARYGLPVVATEFAGLRAIPQALEDLMKYMNSHGWGYSYWTYFGGTGDTLLEPDWTTLSLTGHVFVDNLTTPTPLDLPTVGGVILVVTDAILIVYYLASHFDLIGRGG